MLVFVKTKIVCYCTVADSEVSVVHDVIEREDISKKLLSPLVLFLDIFIGKKLCTGLLNYGGQYLTLGQLGQGANYELKENGGN